MGAVTPLITRDATVPARLVQTAIEQFGTRGTHAVSLREIQRKAGISNEAAVRYYFKNRLGLLDACLQSVAEQFEPLFDEAWAELEANTPIQARTLVTAVVISFYSLWQQHPAGVQLVARMIREEGAAGQDMLLERFSYVIWRIEESLQELLPEKSAEAIRLHSFLAINSIVNGMVDQTLLWRLPAVDGKAGLYSLPQEQLAQGFIDYVTAGLCSASDLDA